MFQIRPAGSDPNDVATLLAIFDSTIPALAAAGNGAQWGSQPFSEKPGFLEETTQDVEKSETFRLTGQGERVRTFIAQREDDGDGDGLYRHTDEQGKPHLAAGAITIRDSRFSGHLYAQEALKPHIDAAERLPGGFVFIECLISDFRLPPEKRRGAGAALVEAARAYAAERKMQCVFVDCWTGGEDKLVP